MTTARYARIVCLNDVNNTPNSAAGEFTFLTTGGTPLTNTGWTIVADSQETPTFDVAFAFDGATTPDFWHTSFSSGEPGHPHYVDIDFGSALAVEQVQYAGRSSGANGNVDRVQVYLSTSPNFVEVMHAPVVADDFAHANNPTSTFGPIPTANTAGVQFVAARRKRDGAGDSTVTIPPGVQAGDYAVLIIWELGSNTGPTLSGNASGMTPLHRVDGAGFYVAAYGAFLSGSETSWGVTHNGYTDYAVLFYRNVNTTTPLQDAADGNGTGTSATAPAVTAAQSGSLLIATCTGTTSGFCNSSGCTVPGAMVLRIADLDTTIEAMDELLASTGSTGTRTIAMGNSQDWLAVSLLLNPAGAPAPPSPPPLTLRRPKPEDTSDSDRRRRGLPPLPAGASVPLRLRARDREDVVTDLRQRRIIALPFALVPNIAPLIIGRDREEAPGVELRRRAITPPAAPAAGLAALSRRSTEQITGDELARRRATIPAPQTSDTAPRQNRRSAEQDAPSETAQRTHPTAPPSTDFSPPLARRAAEQKSDEEALRRALPAIPGAAPVPSLPRRILEWLDVEEWASSRRSALPLSVDLPPLVTRGAVRESTTDDELATRAKLAPQAVAASTILAPSRRAQETEPAEFVSRGRAVPLPPADTAPLRSRAPTQDVATEEQPIRLRAAVTSPVVAALASIPRRLLELIGIEESPPPQRRAVPLPLSADLAPLRARGSARDLANNEEAAVRPRIVQQPAATVSVANRARRTTQETEPGEFTARRRAVPLPLTADRSPARNRATTEQGLVEESKGRSPAPVQPQAPGPAPLGARRSAEYAAGEEPKARARTLPAQSLDFAPLNGRRAAEQSTSDETVTRSRAPVTQQLNAPLSNARAREEATWDESPRRPAPSPPTGATDSPPPQMRRPLEWPTFEDFWRRIRSVAHFIGIPVAAPPPRVIAFAVDVTPTSTVMVDLMPTSTVTVDVTPTSRITG